MLVALTVAPPTDAPCGSSTLPTMVAKEALWLYAASADNSSNPAAIARDAVRSRFVRTELISTPRGRSASASESCGRNVFPWLVGLILNTTSTSKESIRAFRSH